MQNDNEVTRQSAHLWLDALSASQDDLYAEIVTQILPLFENAGAFTATYDDETDVVTSEVTPLLISALTIMNGMLGTIAQLGHEETATIVALRGMADSAWSTKGPEEEAAKQTYLELIAAVDSGTDCPELFAIRNRISKTDRHRTMADDVLRQVGCHSSTSTRGTE